MDIVQLGQIFPKNDFHESNVYTVIIYHDQDGNLFYAKFPDEIPDCRNLDPNDYHKDLHGVPLPVELVYPRFIPDQFTIASEPLSTDCYEKMPRIIKYNATPAYEGNIIAETLRHEAIACEVFKRHPHPNIARYLGCKVRNGRITGLCFQRYNISLRELLSSSPEKVNKKTCLAELRHGIEHMHAHGYVHNDISPYNIMMDDDNNSIIIDFDSCRPIGDEKGRKLGTEGFYRKDVKISEPENDFYPLEMLAKYIDTSLSRSPLIDESQEISTDTTA